MRIKMSMSILSWFLSMFLLFRRDTPISLRYSLLLGYDRSLLSSQNGTIHTALPVTPGEVKVQTYSGIHGLAVDVCEFFLNYQMITKVYVFF